MKSGSPQMNDFSHEAIRKEVFRNGLTHWLTIYPPAVGLPLGLAGMLFNLPILYPVMIGSLSLGLGSAIVNIFFRNKALARQHIEQLNRKLKRMEKIALESLEKDLKECLAASGLAGEYAGQAVEQYRRMQDKYRNVEKLLAKKLQESELTFGRFLGAAEQVYLSGLDNLRQIEATLQSAMSIDPNYINQRLKSLARLKSLDASDRQEKETLTKRFILRQKQLDLVNMLLTANEEAMTKLEETTAAIAAMRTDGRFARTDYETAISQLQEMAERASRYSDPPSDQNDQARISLAG